jgi:hypothetical protein
VVKTVAKAVFLGYTLFKKVFGQHFYKTTEKTEYFSNPFSSVMRKEKDFLCLRVQLQLHVQA